MTKKCKPEVLFEQEGVRSSYKIEIINREINPGED
jgi:hypothetical protein